MLEIIGAIASVVVLIVAVLIMAGIIEFDVNKEGK
jgi:hypothetical protein